MNSLRDQIISQGLHKSFNNITCITAGIRNLMISLGFKDKHVVRVLRKPDWRKDMRQFATHYHIHLTEDEYKHLQNLVDRLENVL